MSNLNATNTSRNIQNLCSKYTHKPTNVHNRKRKRSSQPVTLHVSVFHEPETSLNEFPESTAKKITSGGSIVVEEGQPEISVLTSIAALLKNISEFEKEDINNLSQRIRFLKRDGKLRTLTKHLKGPGFSYDGKGVKEMRTSKDAKRIYIYVAGSKPNVSKAAKRRVQLNDVDSESDDSVTEVVDPNLVDFVSQSKKPVNPSFLSIKMP